MKQKIFIALAITLFAFAVFFSLSPIKLIPLPVRGGDRGGVPPQADTQSSGLTPPLPPPRKGRGTELDGGPDADLEKTKQEMLAQLELEENANRQLKLPAPPPERPARHSRHSKRKPVDLRAAGRKKRAGLPMGVVLWDRVPAYDSFAGRKELYEMMTGDFVRIFPDGTNSLHHVQPGLDIYLAATTKEIKPAGERFPDRDVWIKKSDLHIFEPEPAKEFLLNLDPVTLGNDTSFSTQDFYDRAMKNPDVIVHRVIGPRLIALVLLHSDYSSSWSALYRDNDPKIRDAALAQLRERGVGNSREVIEDLITRLAELTRTRARGETELEVLSILSILQESGHPRVPAALASFAESWKDTQSQAINDVVKQILEKK